MYVTRAKAFGKTRHSGGDLAFLRAMELKQNADCALAVTVKHKYSAIFDLLARMWYSDHIFELNIQ
jgi:hypothetical protein